MLQAYIDDSGSDKRSDKRLVLAGYIQTAEAWSSFSDEWAAVLAAAPALKSLHMTDFGGFTKEEREGKIDALAAVLAKYKPISIECSVSSRDYKELLRDAVPYDLRHPYFPCFVGVLYGVAKALEAEGLKGPVDLIFDIQGNVGPLSALWYTPLKHSDPLLASTLGGPPIFRSDDDVLPLQAADMLAWHVRRVSEPHYEKRHMDVANAIRFRHRYMEMPRELVASWAVKFSKVPGLQEVRDRSIEHSVAKLITGLPPERVVPAFEAMARRARYLRILKQLLERLGLRRLWKKIAKSKITIR
ncbi:DUF3800 domain-containing protein [Polaromonas sp. JS666]|uniref:DUF3800 domain-containing protein n=1 Tax=Polaromonas sp. (strain JS666 / ATCC BAA-500) TaxID=296591 RepID=UPI0018DE3491|nr:DUF3800 domain-containing protein [Polaromonas sp. JS666]